MIEQRTFKAAIFDLDGVIADTARFHFMAWQRLAAELGIELHEAAEDDLKGLERLASLDVVLGERAAEFSLTEKQALAARKNVYYLRLIETLSPADLLEGAQELLQALARRKIPVALASASKNAGRVIDYLGIAPHFRYVADAARIQHPKPHPEIFLEAAKGLDVAPALCLGVEDAVAGVEAINAAGMYSVGVGNANVLCKAAVVVNSLAELDPDRYFG